jgi:diguanylate cyclase (GGDEF)-like protein/PAS domain S-box-containing protein
MPPETALAEIESALLRLAPDAMLVVDRSGRIVDANTLAERLFGYPQGALAGQPLAVLIPDRLREVHQRHVAQYISSPRHLPLSAGSVMWALRRDGSEFAAQVSLNRLESAEGRHVLAAIRDVSEYRRVQAALERATGELEQVAASRNAELVQANAELRRQIAERTQAEAALRDTEAQYRLLVENQPDLICRFLSDTTLTFVNAAYASFFDRLPADLLGQRFIDFLPAAEQATVREQLAAFTPAAPARQYEHRTVRADGAARWHLWHDFAFFDERDEIVGFQSVGVDITERKHAEDSLFEAKERAQVTLHSIGDAVITTDGRAVVEYLNPVAEALTGWTTAEAWGRPLSEVFRVVCEQTHEPAPDPVTRCLLEGKIMGLANHSVLLGRHGQEYHIDDCAAPIRGRHGQVLGAVLVFHDVTESRRLTRQLEYDATHDALTGLVNRSEFARRLQQALASAREFGARHALCYMDLDRFKLVNDTAGHVAGDELLRQMNAILSGMFRERDTLARIGGDEFGLLLENCPPEWALSIAERLVSTVREHCFQWEGRTYRIGLSIGLVPITAETPDTAQLLIQADVACYVAKQLGRNRVHVYDERDSETQRHGEMLSAAGLKEALDRGRFRLHYQPILSLSGGDPQPLRYEALVRVAQGDDDGQESELMLPAAFVPAAERYGLMGTIDRWVIQTAFRDYAAGMGRAGAGIAINLSWNSLGDETLLDFIEGEFERHGVPAHRVCFEITETNAVQNLQRTAALMAALKRRGVQFALDDFGSGLSSLRLLKALSLDYLKIDGSFVDEIVDDEALVAAINQMSHRLGIQTIAECVHSHEIIERLRELGVDFAQGYFLGRPAPWDGAT